VPSRRLGRSLGVDIVPFKVCTLDCVYCQLGKTTETTIERKDYFPVDAVLAELKEKLAQGVEADFIAISGSGEPTLNSRLGELVDGIKKITDIPVAILTNGTLLCRQDVRADCARADVVLPSLDAGDEQTFRRINRPHPGLSQIDKIKDAIKRIRPDKIHLNTPVRPAAEPGVERLGPEKLQAIAEQFGDKCEPVVDFLPRHYAGAGQSKEEDVLKKPAAARNVRILLSMLKRRPCSLNDICSTLGISREQALKYIDHFLQRGLIASEQREGTVFFKAN
jgi:wyosine [tRNA(Phe)-imidazoG37] synthetase (radical SAM superfamily)